jgi:glucose uptake protein GlcU
MATTTTTALVVGLVFAVGSAIFNGSFAVLFKTEKMVQLDIHPMTFQLYVCLGIFVSSFLVVLGVIVVVPHNDTISWVSVFTGWGIVAGGLFVVAVSASFFAISEIGVALAQGIWGGGAMVVSYLWGTLVFGELPSRGLWLSILGLLLLVVGVVAIALCESISQKLLCKSSEQQFYSAIPLASQEATTGSNNNADANNFAVPSSSYARGVLWAATVALFGGSILAPMHYVPQEKQGLLFLPSFGFGCLLISPTVFGLYCRNAPAVPPLHLRQALVTGLLSGLLWNIGNFLSILAIPILSYGVAYPIMQCAILVSGIWGIYGFREITDTSTIQVFWAGGATLVIGGAVLAAAQ